MATPWELDRVAKMILQHKCVNDWLNDIWKLPPLPTYTEDHSEKPCQVLLTLEHAMAPSM